MNPMPQQSRYQSVHGSPMRPPYSQQAYSGPRPYPPGQMVHGIPGPPRMGMPGTPGGHMPHPYAVSSTPPRPPSTPSPGPSKASSASKSKDTAARDRESMPRPGMPHPGMPGTPMDSRKRPPPGHARTPPQALPPSKSKKKKKVADKILPQRVRDLVPESQAYMDLLDFERKLDSTIMRKKLDIQEALKRPIKQKRKLRIFISNTYYPAKMEREDGDEPLSSWELRVEGRLLEEPHTPKSSDPSKSKKKFSSFFKSLVIELDKDLYGPDNHLVEWHRTGATQETDGFQVKRPGELNVKCTVLLMLDYQPMQFKLHPRLARLLGMHTQTRPVIINALWQYIKTHKLQDPHEREYINCDQYLEPVFLCKRLKFAEIPQKLHTLLMPPDPIVINHLIAVEGQDAKKTACYDIDVEVDDNLKQQMNSFLLSSQSQQEITSLDNKIHETVETINSLKTNRDFFLSFTKDPQEFINNWLVSQSRDLKTVTDVVGNPEEERRAEFFFQPWAHEAVCRYFYSQIQQRRIEIEQALGIRNT